MRKQKKLVTLVIFIAILSIGKLLNFEAGDIKVGNTNNPIGVVEVHFIDVGQGDAMLIKEGNNIMLIDGGPKSASDDLIQYLRGLGITSIDYVIGTHPHEDHIGGLLAVFSEFEVKSIMMPKVAHTTKTFIDLTTAIKNEGLKVKTPIAGNTIELGETEFLILSPKDKEYNSLNDHSIVLKMTYGKTAFLFTGDAEAKIEEALLKENADIKANVLKLAHHGSNTSNTKDFLKAVDPDFAVIEVGKDNSYNHPHGEVVARLDALEIPYYTTMDLGNIIVISDGETITYNPN